MTVATETVEDLQGAQGNRLMMLALGVTQLISWGTTYYLPAVLTEGFRRDLGLSSPQIFSSVAIMLVVSAFLAWPLGRLMDRQGAGKTLPAGSLFLALGLVVLAMAQNYIAYALSWVIMGVGMALAMSNAAFAVMAQIAGQRARRGIVIIMLFGGMAATVFWPLTMWLDGVLGWRGTCLVFAGLQALVCAPLHGFFLAGATTAERRKDLKESEGEGQIPPALRQRAALLILIAMAGNGFVSWGLDLHLIAILQQFGLSPVAAVAVAAWKGPATLMARGFDILAAGRMTPLLSALIAGALIPAGLALALVFAAGLPAAILFITIYSFGTGLMTVARATLPLALLGAQGFATTIGRLTLPTQLIYAVSPMTFGLFLERFGLMASLWLGLLVSLVALAALGALARLAKC